MIKKELIFKILITVGIILLIISTIFFVKAEMFSDSMIESENNANIGLIFMGLSSIFGISVYIMMGNIKLTSKKLKSKRIMLNTNTYEEFEEKFLEELRLNNYFDYIDIPNNLNCEIKYLIRKRFNINDIVLILRTNELSEDVSNSYFEISLNYIVEKEKYITKNNTNIIHIICVDRVNDNLRKLTENSAEQGYGRFNLPVGISFGYSTVYIAPQKEGFYIMRYRELVKMLESYLKNQIKSD